MYIILPLFGKGDGDLNGSLILSIIPQEKKKKIKKPN